MKNFETTVHQQPVDPHCIIGFFRRNTQQLIDAALHAPAGIHETSDGLVELPDANHQLRLLFRLEIGKWSLK